MPLLLSCFFCFLAFYVFINLLINKAGADIAADADLITF